MKFILNSIGTRGDMEPFLAIGTILKKKGHEVVCLFPEQFRSLAEDSDLRFISLGSEFIDLLDSDDGKAALGGSSSGFPKILAYFRLARKFQGMNKQLVQRQREAIDAEQPDKIIRNGKPMYPVLWSLKTKKETILISPVPYLHYVKGHAHLAFNGNFGSFINKLTYAIGNFGIRKTELASAKWLKLKVSSSAVKQQLEKEKTIYTISPSLFPRPDAWPQHLQVLGYHERDKAIHWKPDSELLNFLEKHPKILFLSFGSMTNPKPEEKTNTFLQILEKHKIPALINTGKGGLQQSNQYQKELFHFVDQIPYDWAFNKMYAAIHHGGSGTTHMSLKHGCATMIIPHIIDQFVWNKMVAEKGAGPLGMAISKIKSGSLEDKILDLWNNTNYKQKALQISRKMQSEDFEEVLYQSLIS